MYVDKEFTLQCPVVLVGTVLCICAMQQLPLLFTPNLGPVSFKKKQRDAALEAINELPADGHMLHGSRCSEKACHTVSAPVIQGSMNPFTDDRSAAARHHFRPAEHANATMPCQSRASTRFGLENTPAATYGCYTGGA